MSAHQGSELLAHTLEDTESVVLAQSSKEVLQNVILSGTTGDLRELLDDLGLVGLGQGGRVEDRGQLRVLLEGVTEGREGLGGLLEAGGLCGGSVL